jgi:hypothetical protein
MVRRLKTYYSTNYMYRYIVHRKRGGGGEEEGGYPVVLSGMRVNFFVHGKHLLSTHTHLKGGRVRR